MGYTPALSKAWSELKDLAQEQEFSVRLLSDQYNVDIGNERILSLSCNAPCKDHIGILILHYLKQKLKGLPVISGEWVSFKQLEGGQGYYPAFQKRVIAPIMRKYGLNPEAILGSVERFNAKRAQLADASVVIDILEGVPILITLWHGDEEFGPEANVLFDKSIKDIFCTEDVVILAEFLARSI